MENTPTIIPDKFDNSIIISGNIISIKLKNEARTREIGVINQKERYFAVNRIREKHFFRKNNSYGFNHYILANAKQFDFVIIALST